MYQQNMEIPEKKSEKRGPLPWEQTYRLLETIQKNPDITAAELQEEGAAFGVEISIRTAFRFLSRYRKSHGNIFGCSQSHLKVVAEILESLPPGKQVTTGEIQTIAEARGIVLHLSTVYRIIDRLVAAGTVARIERGRQNYYEWSRPGQQHSKLTCVVCGTTVEFHQDYLDGLAKRICDSFDFEFQQFEFNLQAKCRTCRTQLA